MELQEQQKEYVHELTERINGQLLEIAELHRKNTYIYKEIGVLEQQLSENETLLLSLQEEKERLETECSQKDVTAAQWRNKAERLEEEKERLRVELEAGALREKNLAEHIAGMESSRSWRVTKPLRAFKRLVKRRSK